MVSNSSTKIFSHNLGQTILFVGLRYPPIWEIEISKKKKKKKRDPTNKKGLALAIAQSRRQLELFNKKMKYFKQYIWWGQQWTAKRLSKDSFFTDGQLM